MDTLVAVYVISALSVLSLAWRALYSIWWKPMKLQKYLRKQGIKGPSYRLFFGNLKEIASATKEAQSKPINISHNIVQRVFPFDHQTIERYGKLSFVWHGRTPRVNIMDPDLIRDILSHKFAHQFRKLKGTPLTDLLATGIVSYEGEKWVKHRRIITPVFHLEKLKMMLPEFYTSCSDMISKWESLVMESHELDVWPDIQKLSGDAISRAAFGSSFEEGRRIFELVTEQAILVMQVLQSVDFPGLRFIPTKRNNRIMAIAKEVRDLLGNMIVKRENAMKKGNMHKNDLLGVLMESNFKEIQANNNVGMSLDEVIEECKLFYIAGQETTSTLLVWTMIVLSMHPEWQVKAREEVLQIFGKTKPDFEGLNKLKVVTTILYEVLRLYPPAARIWRTTYRTINLGDLCLPPGVQIQLPMLFVHHSRELWGADAEEFNPERFSEGISKVTKNQVSFFPFGWGPRLCLGQAFAMIEAKLVLTMILQRFCFELSSTYVHAPYTVVALQPQHGAQLIMHKL